MISILLKHHFFTHSFYDYLQSTQNYIFSIDAIHQLVLEKNSKNEI